MRACLLVTCRKPLVRREDERPDRWRNRRFCTGNKCATRHLHFKARARSGMPEKKTCPHCGAVFDWPILMPPSEWGRKDHCSVKCGTAAPLGARPKTRAPRPKLKPRIKVSLVHPRRSTPPAKPVWRPAGWSKTPNVWAGHRPLVNLTKESTWQYAR